MFLMSSWIVYQLAPPLYGQHSFQRPVGIVLFIEAEEYWVS